MNPSSFWNERFIHSSPPPRLQVLLTDAEDGTSVKVQAGNVRVVSARAAAGAGEGAARPVSVLVCVNLTQVCVNLTQVCVNRTQALVNLTQVCSPVAGHAAELEAATRRCLARLRNALERGVLPGAVGTRVRLSASAGLRSGE